MRAGYGSLWDCFPTGRHYPGIAHLIARTVQVVRGVAKEFETTADWRELPLAVVDFETTGLDPTQDRVLEMGIVLFDGGQLTSRHNWLINPTIPVPEESRKVHGISDEDLRDAPRFEQVAGEIVGLLEGRLPVAYNATFDQRFFHAEFERLGKGEGGSPALRNDVVWVDPLVWVRELFKYDDGGRKLTDVCERLGIEIGQAHRAADDATATGRVLFAIANDLPPSYGELIRIQRQYEAQQEAEFVSWRPRRN